MKTNLVILLTILLLSSCRIEQQEKKGPLHIVVTTGIIEDGVKKIVGDYAEVSALMGPGTDPHLYKPTPSDVELLEQADVIVCNGLHLEGKMAEMLNRYSNEKPVLNVSDGIDKNQLIRLTDSGDGYDPHIWFDTEIWSLGLSHITKKLSEIDTVNADNYLTNFIAYQNEIKELDKWVFDELNSIEKSQRILITSHDAFSYFGRRYDIEVKGIQGISTLSEVGLKEITQMVDFLISRNLHTIFVETSTSQKTAQSIADGCKAKKHLITLEGPLYSDALGEPDSEAGTYIGMMKTNIKLIVNGINKTNP